jgi:hypothetical protein
MWPGGKGRHPPHRSRHAGITHVRARLEVEDGSGSLVPSPGALEPGGHQNNF